MAPFQHDENVVFLYICLQHSSGPGKIDWDAVANATKSTKGATAMRYRRLKEKIEPLLSSGGVTTSTSVTAAPKPNTSKGSKKTSVPRKRKAPATDDDDEDVKPILPQVNGSTDADSFRRQTRGKKLDFDVFTAFVSDDDSSLMSFESGDSDYVANTGTAKSEDDGDSLFSTECDQRPAVKRAKPTSPQTHAELNVSTPKAVKEHVPTTPPSSSSKLKSNVMASEAERKVASKIGPKPKTSVKPTMHVSQQPLPSIEYSPPASPTPAAAVPYKSKYKHFVMADDDVDLSSLKPGMRLDFNKMARESRCSASNSDQSQPPLTIASSMSSTHDSAGEMLNQNLGDWVQKDELRPQDSVSSIDSVDEEVVEVPATPRGIAASTFRFFKGLLTPQS